MWLDFKSKIASHGLNVILFQHVRGIAGIKQNCQAAESGDKLTQEFEPLTSTFGGLHRQTRDVAARTRKACDEAAADRIARDYDDRDGSCRLLQCGDGGSIRENDMDLLLHEFGRNFGNALRRSLRPPIFDGDRATLNPAEFTQSLGKSSPPSRIEGCRVHHVRDGRPLARLLRSRRQRPCRYCGTSERDELAPPHGFSLTRTTPYHIAE
jgi:hypothetical protein